MELIRINLVEITMNTIHELGLRYSLDRSHVSLNICIRVFYELKNSMDLKMKTLLSISIVVILISATSRLSANENCPTHSVRSAQATCIDPTDGGTIDGNQSGCDPYDPVVFTSISLPTGYTGNLEYKWQQSTTGPTSGFSDIANSNAATYDSGSMTATTWFKRLSRVDCSLDWSTAAESNVLEVSIVASPQASIASVQDVSCFGQSDGSIDVDITGTTDAQDTTIAGVQTGTFAGTLTRGYWFQAQSSFIITSVMAADESNPTATLQSVEIVDFGTNPPQPAPTTTAHTTLFSAIGIPAGWTSCNVEIVAGNYYGVIGAKHNDGNITVYNSYSTNNQNFIIDGVPTACSRLILQASLASGSPASGSYFAQNNSLGRLHITTQSFDYQWTGSNAYTATSEDISDIPAGNYSLSVTDNNGCTATTSAVVDEPPSLVSCPSNQSLCSNDPALDLTTLGATPSGGTFSGTGVSANVFDPTVAGIGTHSITFSYSDGGCNQDCNFDISVGGTPEISTPVIQDVSCYGLSDGSIDVDITGTPDVQDTTLAGEQTNSFAGTLTRGYWFQAQSSFLITNVKAAEEGNPAATHQSVEIVDFGTNPPQPAPTVTAHTTLFSGIGIPAGWTPCNVEVVAGNYYGIIGAKHNDGNITVYNSYSTNNQNFIIDGIATVCSRLILQSSLVAGSPGSGSYFSQNSELGRIHITTISFDYEWTGPNGYASTIEDISELAAGNYSLSVSNNNGCLATTQATVSEPPSLGVSCPSNQQVLVSDASVDLTLLGAIPAGGTFTGQGVASNSFNPATAGVGVHTINYAYSDGNGCTEDCNFTITVIDNLVVTCPPNQDVCISTGTIDLTTLGATPSGGTFSGTGVTNNSFDPSIAGIGTHTINYSYNNGGSTDDCDFSITVQTIPTITCPSYQEICLNDGVLDLTTLGATPTGGEFTGTGVTTNSFDPAIAGIGKHTINYTISDGSGCTNECTFDITVLGIPDISTPIIQDVSCYGQSDGSIEVGVTGTSDAQDTTLAGVQTNVFAGTLTRGYWFQAQSSFIITSVMAAEEGNPGATLQSVEIVDFGTNPPQEAPNATAHTTLFSAIGIPSGWTSCNVEVVAGKYYGIIGAKHNDGNITVYNSYSTNNQSFTIDGIPTVCSRLILQASLASGSPASGSYFAQSAELGRLHITTLSFDYEWTGPNGYTANSEDISGLFAGTYSLLVSNINNCEATTQAVVDEPASQGVSCPTDQQYQISDPTVDLTLLGATPTGGVFSGQGVVANSFDPSIAGFGVHTINYAWSDGNGCTEECNFTITVNGVLTVSCPANQEICSNEGILDLSTLGASPPGGTYTGSGVSNNSFDPSGAGTGSHTITYSYTDGGGSSANCNFIITVKPAPVVTCPPNQELCFSSERPKQDTSFTLSMLICGGSFTKILKLQALVQPFASVTE
jgi:hypothetical protein